MFTAWGFGEEYINSAMSALGMSTRQILYLAAVIAAMALLYRLTAEGREKREVGLSGSLVREERTNIALFVYGILAIARFGWLYFPRATSADLNIFNFKRCV